MTLTCVALGLDHRHIYGMTENMERVGVRCVGYWTNGDPVTLPGYVKRFPHVPRLDTLEAALNSGADLALISCIPGASGRSVSFQSRILDRFMASTNACIPAAFRPPAVRCLPFSATPVSRQLLMRRAKC